MCLPKISLVVALEGAHVRKGLEVVIWHSRSLCAKFGIDRGSGGRDVAGQKV